jgi:hypothetical protein
MIKIVGLILPWETYFLPKIISSFISCKSYLTEDECKNIKFSLVYSNVPEQINWEESLAPPLYTENIFKQCCSLLSKYYNVEYEINNDIKGCVGHRRIEFNKNDYNYCMTFDFDMNFPPNLLKSYVETIKHFDNNDLLVITPQPDKELEVKQIEGEFKWFGGMFPCYSKGYLKEYPLHEGLGNGYGPDDSYLMLKGLKYKKVKQYLIKNLVVENSKNYCGHFTNKSNYKLNYLAKKISDENLIKLI